MQVFPWLFVFFESPALPYGTAQLTYHRQCSKNKFSFGDLLLLLGNSIGCLAPHVQNGVPDIFNSFQL